MDVAKFISIFVSAIFIHNVILSRFLGLCPFIGVSRETKSAFSMSLAVSFVITIASIITWCIYRFLLIPFDLQYLRTISFILVIATSVQLVEMFIRKFSPYLYRSFGIYLPLITTNCAVMGVAVLNIDMFFKQGGPVVGSFFYSLFQAVCVGLGFTLALMLMSGIRERLQFARVPESLRNIPITFIIASLMSLAFMGFNGFRL
jgi:electron transport complex protein RnfA